MNNRRRTYNNKKEKILFELYNTYFDGTVNSVIDTGLKLWDGTHNKFRIEITYDKITGQVNNETLFTNKPDVSPYSGLRIRTSTNNKNSCDFSIGEQANTIENPGNFSITTNTYGSHVVYQNSGDVQSAIIERNNDLIYFSYAGKDILLERKNKRTSNTNLLIGCDYKNSDSTQRYYKGTIYKFVITEL